MNTRMYNANIRHGVNKTQRIAKQSGNTITSSTLISVQKVALPKEV